MTMKLRCNTKVEEVGEECCQVELAERPDLEDRNSDAHEIVIQA